MHKYLSSSPSKNKSSLNKVYFIVFTQVFDIYKSTLVLDDLQNFGAYNLAMMYKYISDLNLETHAKLIIADVTETFYADVSQEQLPQINAFVDQFKTNCNKSIQKLYKNGKLLFNLPSETKILDNSKTQRRMDSLARLLSVSNDISSCVALAIVDQQLYIAFTKSKLNAEIVQEFIEKKIKLIQNYSVTKTHSAQKVVETLISKENGGFNRILPHPIFRKHANEIESLVSALLKISEFEPIKMALQNKINWVSYEDILNLKLVKQEHIDQNCSIHADQLLCLYLVYLRQTQLLSAEKIHIGLPKLCCSDCTDTLSQYDWISFRGGSGIHYHRSLNSFSDQINDNAGQSFVTREFQYCPDSDSDPEDEKLHSEKNIFTIPDDFKKPQHVEKIYLSDNLDNAAQLLVTFGLNKDSTAQERCGVSEKIESDMLDEIELKKLHN